LPSRVCDTKAKSGPVKRFLVNGAGGGVGTFAIQLAKNAGAEVTGVDSGDKLETIVSAGADHVVDSTKEDFSKNGLRYDTVLDVVATRSVIAHRRALADRGRYVIVGGTTGVLLQTVTFGSLLSATGSKKTLIVAHKPNHADLQLIGELFASDLLVPIIDSSFPLEETVDGFRRFGGGQHKGKVVIAM
jgi:NADPH:quinone reductase-like Zn-dependent oxidoreductase